MLPGDRMPFTKDRVSHLPMVIVPLCRWIDFQSSGSDRHVGAISCQVTTPVKLPVLQAQRRHSWAHVPPRYRNKDFIDLAGAVGAAAAIGNGAPLAVSEELRTVLGDPIEMTGHSTGTVRSPHERHVTASSVPVICHSHPKS